NVGQRNLSTKAGGGEVLRKWAGIWDISAMKVWIVDRCGPGWNSCSSNAQEGATGVQCSPFSKSKGNLGWYDVRRSTNYGNKNSFFFNAPCFTVAVHQRGVRCR